MRNTDRGKRFTREELSVAYFTLHRPIKLDGNPVIIKNFTTYVISQKFFIGVEKKN